MSSKHFDNFDHLINDLNLGIDLSGISESRILKVQSSKKNKSLQNYVIEKILAESTAVGVALCINTKDSYEACLNLLIYKSKKLGSIFIEIILSKKNNLIIGCMYRHSCMDICTFIGHYLKPLLGHLTKEARKMVFNAFVFTGDFEIDLSNVDGFDQINTFFEDLASNSIQP